MAEFSITCQWKINKLEKTLENNWSTKPVSLSIYLPLLMSLYVYSVTSDYFFFHKR